MKRLSIIIALTTALLSLASTAQAASPHFQKVTPGCSVSGYTVSCDSSVIAGVGNFNADATLRVNVGAHVDCYNAGVNPQNPIESHEATSSGSATSGQLEPKNGKLVIPALSASASASSGAFPCPNPNWTAVVTVTSFSWTYTITFLTNPPSVFFRLSS